MNEKRARQQLSRRQLLKLGTQGALLVAAGSLLPGTIARLASRLNSNEARAARSSPGLAAPASSGPAAPASSPVIVPKRLVATDGFIKLIGREDNPLYVFGFREAPLGAPISELADLKGNVQAPAPIIWVDEDDELHLTVTNIGLVVRPDLDDAHTVHWHGFRDAIPYFDGEPHGSVAVPIGKDFTYVYRPHEPGTYMYHCHIEDVEHVQMGMTGMVFVRPAQDGNTSPYPSGKYAYNDGDGSTGFDREFVMLLTEVWAEAHWDDAHIQLPEWSDYKADFSLLNGRVYPDTLAPSGSVDPFNPATDANGDLIPTPGYGRLQYQPNSSLVQCNEGERVLLRFANLGFLHATMSLAGIKMRVVGEDATPKRSRDGTDTSYMTNSISISAGASYDAIFTAPPYVPEAAGYNTYLLYNRNYRSANNLGGGYGGQMTEVRVFQTGTLGPQALPNT